MLNFLLPSVIGFVKNKLKDKGNIGIDDVLGALKQAPQDPEVQKAELDAEKTMIKAQESVIVAEIVKGTWMTKNWRPCLMFLIMAIIAYNYLIYDIASAFIELPAKEEIPEHMWQLIKISVGGYVVGRSGESIAKHMKK